MVGRGPAQPPSHFKMSSAHVCVSINPEISSGNKFSDEHESPKTLQTFLTSLHFASQLSPERLETSKYSLQARSAARGIKLGKNGLSALQRGFCKPVVRKGLFLPPWPSLKMMLVDVPA